MARMPWARGAGEVGADAQVVAEGVEGVVDAVREVGRAGIAAVRAQVPSGIGARALRRTRLRRWLGRSVWTMSVLYLVALVPVVGSDLLFRAIGEHFQAGGIFIIAGVGWLAVVPFALMLNEPGVDPAATVRAALNPASPQARRVAVDGLDGLTAPDLRAALTETAQSLQAG